MSDFKAKMHQIVCPLGKLTALPRPPSCILREGRRGKERSRGKRRKEEKERKGDGTGRGPPALPLHPQPLHSR